MARTKRKEHKYPVRKATPSQDTSRAPLTDTLNLTDYLALNGIFTAFCLIQLVLIRVLLPHALGLYFFFGFLIVSFAIVSAFDYFASKFTHDNLATQQEQVNG